MHKVRMWWVVLMTGIAACNTGAFERHGTVVDAKTLAPVEGVNIEVYMASVTDDTLKEKVFTDANGHFHIHEKRPKSTLFELHKEGYTDLVSALFTPGDTIRL